MLKQKGTKKPEGKSKKEENKQQDDYKKEKKKNDKKKTDFHWQKPRTNQTKGTVEGKEYYWCPNHQNKITKERGQWVCHQPKDSKNKHQKQSNKTSDGDAQAKQTTSLQPNANLAALVDNGFIQACKDNNQGIAYCGVNAHFQNSIAEKRIQDLREQARTMLLLWCISGLECCQWHYGHTLYKQPTRCAMQPLWKIKPKHQWSYLPKWQSPQSSSISTHLDVLHTSSTISCKETKPFRNGKQDHT